MGTLEMIEQDGSAVVTQIDRHEVAPISYAPTDLLTLAIKSGASMDLIERLVALQERREAGLARQAFVAAMSDFKAEPLEIFKRKAVGYLTKENEFVGYKHAELSDVTGVVVPAMARYGLSHGWKIEQGDGRIVVTCTVTHKQGHSESVTMDAAPDNSGKKNAIQQIASAVTYLQRYTLLAIVGLATQNEVDDDGAGAGDATGDKPRSVVDEWIEKAEATTTLPGLNDVVRGGLAVFAKDRRAYSVFGEAVAKHRAKLRTAAPPAAVDSFVDEMNAAEAKGAIHA